MRLHEGFDHHDIYTRLRSGAWFGSLPPSMAEALFGSGRLENYAAGEYVYHENEPPHGLFCLVTGSVHMEKCDVAGQRVLIHVACPGFWFGEVASNGPANTHISTRCFDDSSVLRVPYAAVAALLAREGEFRAYFSLLIASRATTLVDIALASRRPTTLSQIAARLLILDREARKDAPEQRPTLIRMPQSDLADMTGHARQTINAVMKRLEQDKVIQIGHRQIEIIDPQNLERYSICDEVRSGR